jgi:serine/threonine protein kinase
MGEPAVLHPQLRKLIGTVIDDRYTVDEVIGAGGMGVVFRGRQLMLRRDVAIKVMNPDLSHEMTARFTREAESAARLDHPNCITVYEFGTYTSGLHYMVMPLLDGKRLTQVLQTEYIPARRAVDMGVQILRGLEHAHCRGVIHRDVKPDNIVVVKHEDGTELLKVVDFGLAKIISTEQQWADSTMSGLMSGTPAYMSPEQALGLPTDTRSDIYSAGFILYRMLTGALPFEDEDPIAQMRRHITDEVPPLPESIPKPLARVIERMVRKERNLRYGSITEALTDLEAIRKGAHFLPGDSVASPPAFASLSSGQIGFDEPADNTGGYVERPTRELPTPTLSAMDSLSTQRKGFPVLVAGGAVVGILGVALVWWLANVPTGSAAQPAAQAEMSSASATSDAPGSQKAVPGPSPAVTPAPDLGADMLQQLTQVNEKDPAKVLDYRERHEMLAHLATSPTAAKLVDTDVNVGFDLLQAGQSSTPCTTFATALSAIEASKESDFVPVLQRARAPDPVSVSGAGKAPDGSCEGLEERRAALLAQLSGAAASEPSTKRRPGDRRGKPSAGKPSVAKPDPKATKPGTKPSATKPGAERTANPWENGQIDEVKNPFGG